MSGAVLRDALEVSACAFGIHHLSRRLYRDSLLIVCYHGVTTGPLPALCPDWHHVDVADFRRQVRYLAAHYEILAIDEAIDARADGRQSIACITFDDGYRNNLDVALPVLRQLRVPATLYLSTGFVGTDRVLWTVRLEAAIRQTSQPTGDFAGVGLGTHALGGDDDRRRIAGRVIARLKAMPASIREEMVDALIERFGEAGSASMRAFAMLDWAQIETLEQSGLITLGAHTVNHEILSRLEDAVVEREIADSVSTIAAHAVRPSTTFAYPNGRVQDFDGRARRSLEAAGIRAAVSTVEGLNTAATDRFELRRVVIGRNTRFATFRLAVSGAAEWKRRVQ